MSAQIDSDAHRRDPDNRLLHHYPARRLDAESIRDVLLATSGRLDPRFGGLSVDPYREKPNAERRLFVGSLDGNGRRSLYIKTNLMEPARFLSAFNKPGGKVAQGRRDVSNVPAQALALLNDPFVIQQAEVWAEALVKRPDRDAGERLEAMFQRALGRPATSDEGSQFGRLVEQLREYYELDEQDVMRCKQIWRDVAHVVFNLKEFIYLP